MAPTGKILTVDAGVDGALRRIEQVYDNRLRLHNITSYDATSGGNPHSDIEYDYNNFGQLIKEYQQPAAAVNVSTSPAVAILTQPWIGLGGRSIFAT